MQFFFNIVESAEKLLDPPYMITCMAHWRVQIYNYINIHTKILITYINTYIHSYLHTYTYIQTYIVLIRIFSIYQKKKQPYKLICSESVEEGTTVRENEA